MCFYTLFNTTQTKKQYDHIKELINLKYGSIYIISNR